MTWTADVTWDGYNWVAHIRDHPGAVTFARRLDLLAADAAEVVRLVTGELATADDVELVVNVGDDTDTDLAAEVRALRRDLSAKQELLAFKTELAVAALRYRGLTVRDIGTITGLSHQRVQQVLAERGLTKASATKKRASATKAASGSARRTTKAAAKATKKVGKAKKTSKATMKKATAKAAAASRGRVRV